MIRKQRITRVSRALTAHERAVMCTRATLDQVPEDPLIRETMPLAQVDEFNCYLALANGTLHVMPYVFCFAKDVECAALRLSFLLAMRSAEADAALAVRVPEDFRELWAALLAYEEFVEELVDEFGDPVVVPRLMLDAIKVARKRLTELLSDAEPFCGPLQLPGTDRELLSGLRGGAHRDAKLYL